MTSADAVVRVCQAGSGQDHHPFETTAAVAFASYPLDGQESFALGSLIWAADHGYYAFRNGFTGENDFIMQVFANALHTGGSERGNAGTMRLMGSSKVDSSCWQSAIP